MSFMFDDGCIELETYNTQWHTRTLYANPTDFTYLNIQNESPSSGQSKTAVLED